MLLVLDHDGCLSVHESIGDAEAHLETIDIENGEYRFCDETGQPYVGEVVQPARTLERGTFRILAQGARDPSLPAAFVAQASEFSSSVPGLNSLDDARVRFNPAKT